MAEAPLTIPGWETVLDEEFERLAAQYLAAAGACLLCKRLRMMQVGAFRAARSSYVEPSIRLRRLRN